MFEETTNTAYNFEENDERDYANESLGENINNGNGSPTELFGQVGDEMVTGITVTSRKTIEQTNNQCTGKSEAYAM